jgi:hypothetical protein
VTPDERERAQVVLLRAYLQQLREQQARRDAELVRRIWPAARPLTA